MRGNVREGNGRGGREQDYRPLLHRGWVTSSSPELFQTIISIVIVFYCFLSYLNSCMFVTTNTVFY